jgi:hypothetical protein
MGSIRFCGLDCCRVRVGRFRGEIRWREVFVPVCQIDSMIELITSQRGAYRETWAGLTLKALR